MLLALAIPILAAKCLPCHNAQSKTAGLDLSTREAAIAGGKSGAAIVPGKPKDSRVLQMAAARKMPPGKPLDETEIAAIRQWITDGAKWTEAKLAPATRGGLDWWAFQPPRKTTPPALAENPIDAFLLAKLREKDLGFAPKADHRTLIRRLHFSLAGLPPTPADLERPYAETMERLLTSPAYADRWGRYWLDIVRYGESDGGEHNHTRGTAWKYRDYVIDAFATDKPYDQFVREQVAGDVMGTDPKLIAATGFLVAGPFDSVTKEINRDELMRKTIRQDELDDFVTTTFATFQALTVNCARCHDHKFDPIPQRDYYRLTAAFHGVTYGERVAHTDAEKKAYDERVAPLKKSLADVRKQLADIEDGPRARLLEAKYRAIEDSRPDDGKHLALNPITNRNRFPAVTAQRFRFVVTGQAGKTEPKIGKLELKPAGHIVSNWTGAKQATPDEPQTLEITLNAPARVGELEWSTDAAQGRTPGTPKIFRFEYLDGSEWKTATSSLDHDSDVEVLLPEVSEAELAAAIGENPARLQLTADRKRIQAQIDAIDPPATAHAAFLEKEMMPAFLLDRGSVGKPTEPLTPGALSAIRTLVPDLPNGSDAERRKALAAWLTEPRNPLTARVIVNRVWYQHFGNGLVNTPSDFGYNGDRPSHPELLDWLAVSFMENGWSIRWLQRLILTSQAWQQSAAVNEKARSVDASNRLVWHMPLKRMDAETLRDSILAVAGTLNPQRGGPSFWLHQKMASGSYLYLASKDDGPEVWRRSVYRFIARGGERVFLDSFDCPDPAVATPQRSVSNTPVQALALLNNSFVLGQAGHLARRLSEEAADSTGRIRRAYQLLYQRDPSAKELAAGSGFIAQHGLDLYCRTLLNTNEFVYVP